MGGELTFGEFFGGLPDRTGRTDDKAAQVARMRSLERFDVEYPRRIDGRAAEKQGESFACESEPGSWESHPILDDG